MTRSEFDAHLLPASSLTARRALAVRSAAPTACAGLAAGAESINPKHWPCEDSVFLGRLEDGAWLAAVADAHWGGLSGEVVARSALDAWRQATAADPASRLRQALYTIDGRLSGRGKDASETTALLVHLRGRRLSWANVGDSVLWVLGADGVTEKNAPNLQFVGRHAIASLPILPTAGSADLAPGDVVLLASDGILTLTSGLEPETVGERLRDPGTPLEQRVGALLRHMSGVGKDNLGIVALEVV